MSGGAQTIAQLDTLASTLMAAGVSADQLHDAVALATNALAAAKTSSVDANAALAAGATEFKNLEQAAVQAGKAQEKAAKLGVVPPEVAAALDAANAALDQQTTALRGLEAAASTAAQKEAELSQTLANVKVAAAQGSKALTDEANAAKAAAAAVTNAAKAEEAELAKKAKAAEAAQAELDAHTKKSVKEAEGFSPIVKQFGDLSDAMSTSQGRSVLLAGAITGTIAVLAALAVALAVATVAFASWAVGLADSSREAKITADAAAALHPELATLSGDFASISADLGAGEADLRSWTKQLKEAHVSAADMPAALRAVATADAALGKGEGLAAFTEQMKAAGGSASKAAEVVDSKLGGLAADRLKGLDAQSAKLHKNLASLFGGLNIEPVLAAMQTLVALFDENTAAGQAMKFLFESVFQPLIDQAQNAAYVIEAFVLGFLIGLTKVYIALKPAIAAVAEFFGFDDTSLSDVLAVATKAGEYAAYVFVGFVAALGAVVGVAALVVGQTVAVAAAVTALIGVVISAGISIVEGVVGAFSSVVDYLSNLSLASIGTDLINGLIDGIINMGPNVLSAITGIADGAINAAKKALGIASPSTVFAEIGGYTGQGFVDGVDSMANDASAAMAGMVEPPDMSSPAITGNFGAGNSAASSTAQSGGGQGSRGGSGSLLGSNNTFIFNGVENAEQAEQRFGEMLTRVIEGDVSSLIPAGAE